MLELWEMQSSHSLTSLPGLLLLGEIATEKGLTMGQTYLFDG